MPSTRPPARHGGCHAHVRTQCQHELSHDNSVLFDRVLNVLGRIHGPSQSSQPSVEPRATCQLPGLAPLSRTIATTKPKSNESRRTRSQFIQHGTYSHESRYVRMCAYETRRGTRLSLVSSCDWRRIDYIAHDRVRRQTRSSTVLFFVSMINGHGLSLTRAGFFRRIGFVLRGEIPGMVVLVVPVVLVVLVVLVESPFRTLALCLTACSPTSRSRQLVRQQVRGRARRHSPRHCCPREGHPGGRRIDRDGWQALVLHRC